METVLYIIHIIVCIAMLPIILLQSGKGGGVSAVFGGGGAGTVFGSRGASNFLTKMTTGAAIVFMLSSIGLSYYSSRDRSVMGGDKAVPAKSSGDKDSLTAPKDEDGTKPADQATPPETKPSTTAQ